MAWCLIKQEICLHSAVLNEARDTSSWRGAWLSKRCLHCAVLN